MGKSNFQVVGGKELQKVLNELGNRGVQAAMAGIKTTCLEILGDAKDRLTSGGHRATSKLHNSGRVYKAKDEKDAYEVVFEAEYAPFVEFGRRPGKGLNEEGVEAVAEWAKKKGILHAYNVETHKKSRAGTKDLDERARQFALWVSGRYKKRGRKGTPFLSPAFEAKKGNVGKNIGREIAKLIKQLETK